jgi:hypothetical protein
VKCRDSQENHLPPCRLGERGKRRHRLRCQHRRNGDVPLTAFGRRSGHFRRVPYGPCADEAYRPDHLSCKGLPVKKGSCHHCGKGIEVDDKIFRNDTCPQCGSDLYCCLNCLDYEPSAPNQCREPQAERVSVKDRRNFCDYFKFREGSGSSNAANKAAEARKRLDALFKK